MTGVLVVRVDFAVHPAIRADAYWQIANVVRSHGTIADHRSTMVLPGLDGGRARYQYAAEWTPNHQNSLAALGAELHKDYPCVIEVVLDTHPIGA